MRTHFRKKISDKTFFDDVRNKNDQKPRENRHHLFGSGIAHLQSIGRGRISREGALDHRESREWRDKIFAAKTVKRQKKI